MNQFSDEVYENMDDISKLIEPFESELNNDLSKFPDEIELQAEDLEKIVLNSSSWYDYAYSSISSLIMQRCYTLNLIVLPREINRDSAFADKAFEVVSELDDDSTQITFDYTNKKIIGGKIFLRKKIVGLGDDEIEKSMRSTVMTSLYYNFNSSIDANKSRVNEIAELFGAKEVRKARKWKDKIRLLIKHYQDMITNRQMNIKDVALFNRFMAWNIAYIKDGNLPAMANITKLKIMLRSGLPIYSMKEEII